MNLIDQPHKALSVWLLGAATFVIGLEAIVPQLRDLLPAEWLTWLVPAALIARLIKQQLSPKTPPADGGTSAGASLALLLACLCSAPFATACTARPAGRDVCYATADADAFRRYLDECKAYESTRDCPAAEAIEADHQKAQAVCP